MRHQTLRDQVGDLIDIPNRFVAETKAIPNPSFGSPTQMLAAVKRGKQTLESRQNRP
jgi:hypothetical protein